MCSTALKASRYGMCKCKPLWRTLWKEYFPKNPPARTTVGGDIAMEGALIEVELVATV
jgi:enamine deaminase RidA (YjgF/YER057c/UK114 family)